MPTVDTPDTFQYLTISEPVFHQFKFVGMPNGDDNSSMTHQSKKKRIDEEQPQIDVTSKPLQLQRRRVWRACESCRRKKIKCDGCEPTCSQCATSGSQCTWLQTKDRAALSRHYVQELEARLLHMESLFTQITPVLEQIGPSVALSTASSAASPASSTDGSTSASVILQTLLPRDKAGGAPPSATGSPTPVKLEDEISESFGQLALDEHGHMRWIGGSSTMSLIQSFRAITTSPLHRVSPMEEDPRSPNPSVNKLYFPASVFFGKIHALPAPEEVEYPERDLADKLVDAYFARFHFLMPVLDKPSFMRKYNHLMDNTHDVAFARAESAFMSLVFAIFACSSRLVEDARLKTSDSADDGGMGMVYYERALILHYISHAHTQVSHVQCFILMASFLCSVNCLPQAWILVGQAVRTGQDLGLHRSPRRLAITPVEKETRRKIWWGVYSMDRMLALALGRPLGVDDTDCDVELPVDVDDINLPEYFTGATMTNRTPSLMAGFIALTSLYKIGGRVLRGVYALDKCRDHLEPEKKAELQRTVEALDTELTKWCEELPVVFKSQPETEEQVSMGAVLCSHYYSVLTTLHRNFLPVKKDQPVAPKSTAKAVSTARSCIRLAPSIKNVVPPSHDMAFFIQHLFSSAVILLLYAMHATEPRAAQAAMDEAKSALVALESWEGSWPGARKCKELLSELTSTAVQAIKEGGKTGEGSNQAANPRPGIPERRRSVTIATLPQGSGSSRLKQKPTVRRNQSRDPSVSSARRNAAPYRVESAANRARSTSRRRGPDEDERDVQNFASYYNSFSSSATQRANTSASPHSSPASVNLPSPAMTSLEPPQETSPRQTFNYSNTPISPVQGQSFDFGMHHNMSPSGSQQPQWNGGNTNGERHGLDIYPGGSGDSSMHYGGGSYGQPSTIDTAFLQYDVLPEMGSSGGLSTTPPTTTFAGTGLPFRGLDFIRNYNPGGYSVGDQDSLWQSFDSGAFSYDPDLPFTLGDITTDSQDGHQHQPR